MKSRRSKQIAASIQRAAQSVIARGFADPRITGLITITRVEVSEDLHDAKLYMTVLPTEKQDLTMHGMRSALKTLRRRVMDQVPMKEFPRLELHIDEGMKQQAVVMALLAKDRAEREARAHQASEGN